MYDVHVHIHAHAQVLEHAYIVHVSFSNGIYTGTLLPYMYNTGHTKSGTIFKKKREGSTCTPHYLNTSLIPGAPQHSQTTQVYLLS